MGADFDFSSPPTGASGADPTIGEFVYLNSGDEAAVTKAGAGAESLMGLFEVDATPDGAPDWVAFVANTSVTLDAGVYSFWGYAWLDQADASTPLTYLQLNPGTGYLAWGTRPTDQHAIVEGVRAVPDGSVVTLQLAGGNTGVSTAYVELLITKIGAAPPI